MPHTDSAKPLYQKIRERLERDIAGGHFTAGQKFPSEAALVQRFGASRITVGRAVRELQERGLLDRVAGSGTYVRGSVARAREGLLFGLVIPNLGETEIFEPICQGIAGSPEARGHGLLWAHAQHAESREEQALELARYCIGRSVAGVFFAPLEFSAGSAEVNARVIRMLHDAGIAVVLLDRRPEDPGSRRECDLVGIDNHRAGYVAAEHLVRAGARRVGFVRLEGHAPTVKTRVRGYQDALADLDAPGQVFTMRSLNAMQWNPQARECDAFVCANDRVAGVWMQTLLHQGVRIPREVRIVGIDDVNYAALLPVPLTTVHQPCREIGETALRVMLERLERPKMAARDVLLDCTLVIRESCGAGDRSGRRQV